MAACRKWGAIFIAACCLLAGGTHMSWARETPAQGNGAAHITVNDTVYGVLHNHRSLMSIKENREVLEHELRACLETHLSIMKRFNSMLAMAI